MTLQPSKFKYKKQQKGRKFNKIKNVLTFNTIKINSYVLIASEFGRISSKQIISLHQSINKIIKKAGRIRLLIFPHIPVTKKPIEVRMGKGKGNVHFWISKVKAGSILCEIETNFPVLALKALRQAKIRLPIKTKILTRRQ